MRAAVQRLAFVLVGIVTLLAPTLAWQRQAHALQTGWLAGNPSVTKQAEIGVDQTFANTKCSNVDMLVDSFYTDWTLHLIKDTEQLCMVSTLNGLINSEGTYIEPNGFPEAHAITNDQPGHNVLFPVPNQDAVLEWGNSSYFTALSLHVYREFFSHLKVNALTQGFDVQDAPDVNFRFADGNSLPFKASTLAMSPNGRYLVADVIGTGYVRIDLDTLEVKPFAATAGYDQFGNALNSVSAIDDTGRYAAVGFSYGGSEQYLKMVDVDSCSTASLPSSIGQPANFNCPTTDLLPSVAGSMPNMLNIASMRFGNDHTLLVDANNGGGKYVRYSVSAYGASPSLVDYLAMGDSYISGEGAGDYRDGTDTSVNKCHQSLVSYPYILGTRFDSFASVACSGANTKNITAKTGSIGASQLSNNQIPTTEMIQNAYTNHLPGYAAQDDFLTQDNPNVVTLSMGGNDVGFKQILEKCISSECVGSYEDQAEIAQGIVADYPRLLDLYRTIQGADPTRRVYVVGYPQIIDADSTAFAQNVKLTSSSRQFSVQLINYLDSVIETAATNAGVFYVNAQHALDGHRLCDPQPAMNGLTEGDDTWYRIANESFHPNKFGQQLLAASVSAATGDLTTAMPIPGSLPAPVYNPNAPMFPAEKDGRPINQLVFDGDDTDQVLFPGGQYELDVTDQNQLLIGGTTLDSVLHSTAVDLGNVQVGADGTIHTSLTLPTRSNRVFMT